jgi:hypothetical protein
MTHPNEQWLTEVAALIKKRDHAMNMIQRWNQVLGDINSSLATIYGLAQSQDTATEPATEQEPDHDLL